MVRKEFTYNGLRVKLSLPSLDPTERYEGRRRVFRLRNPMVLTINYADKCDTEGTYGTDILVAPKGFETDFATLPVALQVILGNRDNYLEEAILHDVLCKYHCPRWIANSKMRCFMLVLGRPWWKRVAIFWGLMLFGYGSPIGRFSNWMLAWIRK